MSTCLCITSPVGDEHLSRAQVMATWVELFVMFFYITCRGYHKKCWHGWNAEEALQWDKIKQMCRMGAAGTIWMAGQKNCRICRPKTRQKRPA